MVKKIKSYSKINLFLKVTEKFQGYHKLYSLIVQLNFYDELLIKENNQNKDNIFFIGKFKIKNQNNTVIKLLNLMKNKFVILKNKNFDILIKKNIPNGSGFGGASSNATAVFNFLKKKYNLKISNKKSRDLLSQIGKDCPLFLDQKVKLIKSSGEKFIEFKDKLKLQVLLIYPNLNLSTKMVFNNLNKISNISYKKSINLKNKRKLLEVCKYYGNDLINPALKIKPKLKTIINLFNNIGDSNFFSMTGSGSAFFVIFDKKKSLLNAQKMIKKQRNSFWTKIVQTV